VIESTVLSSSLRVAPPERTLALAEKRARELGITRVTDITRLDLTSGTFDLAGCARTLHHVRRPELAISELARVTRFGGHVLVIDQIAPGDPLLAVELDRFERARDKTHTRLLPDVDVRSFLEANRKYIVWALLCMVQAWVEEGMPMWTERMLESYESYTQVIGGSTDSEFVHLAWRQNHPDLRDRLVAWWHTKKDNLLSSDVEEIRE